MATPKHNSAPAHFASGVMPTLAQAIGKVMALASSALGTRTPAQWGAANGKGAAATIRAAVGHHAYANYRSACGSQVRQHMLRNAGVFAAATGGLHGNSAAGMAVLYLTTPGGQAWLASAPGVAWLGGSTTAQALAAQAKQALAKAQAAQAAVQAGTTQAQAAKAPKAQAK